MRIIDAVDFLKENKVNRHNSNSILNTQTYVKMEDAIKAVEMVEQPTVDTWISVETALPKGEDIIIYCGKHFGEEEVDTCSVRWFLENVEDMLAWQPLPKPFEPKQEGKQL